MTEGKRLFRVSVSVTIYVLAEDEAEADDRAIPYAEQELRDCGEAYVNLRGVVRGDVPQDGWRRGSLVYGATGDVRLGDAIDACEEAA